MIFTPISEVMNIQELEQEIYRFPIWKNLQSSDLKEFSGDFQVFEFERNTPIAYPGDEVGGAYFVLSGSLKTLAESGEIESYYGPRDVIGCSRLLWKTNQDKLVLGEVPGKIAFISRESFLRFIKKKPSRKKMLSPKDGSGFDPELYQDLLKFHFPPKPNKRERWELEQEVEVMHGRTSLWFLFPKILPGIILMALSPLVFLMPDDFSFWAKDFFLNLAMGILSLSGIVWILMFYFQWRSDSLILTTEFIIRRKFYFKQKGWDIIKVPLDQIQNISLKKHGFWSHFLGLYFMEINTSAEQGNILFSGMPKAENFQKRMSSFLEKGRSDKSQVEQSLLRSFLDRHWPARKRLKPIEIDGLLQRKKPEEEKKPKRGLLSFRWREGEDLLFRRHPVSVIPGTLFPFLSFLGLASISVAILLNMDSVVAYYLSAITGTIGMIFFLWSIWNFWDWSLDRFVVGQHFVVDWDRKPLWFGNEKKQTELENIQSVSVEKKGLASLFFNYGNVQILTAGENPDMIFENVPHPELVQQEIFLRRNHNQNQMFLRQRAARMDEWGQMMKIFEKEKRLGIIP